VLTPATVDYGRSASTVNLLTALGALVFIPMVPVYNFAVDRFGLRVSMLASVFIVFVGLAVRLLSNGTGDVLSPRGFVWVILGIVINAMPGCSAAVRRPSSLPSGSASTSGPPAPVSE
jgi:cyanate permease